MAILIKNEKQIQGIRKSCHLAVDALDHISQFILPGFNTERINYEAEKYILDRGGYPAPLGYRGYPKSVCTSLNEIICHGIPKPEDVLKEGDIVKVDVSTILNGYFGDTCRTFAVGEISNDAQKLISVTLDCLAIGIMEIKPEAEFGMIGKAISKYARSRGCGIVHQFTGHGVGLKFHEEPQISHDDSQYDTTKMQTGMIFTIEPMITLGSGEAVVLEDKWTAVTVDNSWAAQFEHTCLVTDSGVEVLTESA